MFLLILGILSGIILLAVFVGLSIVGEGNEALLFILIASLLLLFISIVGLICIT